MISGGKLKNSWYYYLMPSLFEVFIVLLLSFHLKFPVERSYLLWQHVVLGSQDIKAHKIVTVNPFSYTPTHPLKRSSWLSDDLIYLLFRAGKYRALIILKILLLILMVTLPLFIYKLNASTYSFISPIYLLLLTPGASLRPTLFALLMFFMFHIAYRFKKPIMMGFLILLWSFMHGSYIIGLALLFIKFLQNLRDREHLHEWIIAIIISIIPIFVPHSSLEIFIKLSSQKYILKTFDEWRSPDFKNFLGVIFFLYILLWVIAQKRDKNSNGDFWGGVCFLFLALYARRFIPFFAIFATFDIVREVPLNFDRGFKEYLTNTTYRPFWLFIFFIIFVFEAPNFNHYFIKKYHPYGCENYIKRYPQGAKILTLQAWVPYLYYSTGEKYKFAVDGTLSQTDSILNLYTAFLSGDGCCDEVKGLNADILVFPLKYYKRFKDCCRGCLKIEHIDSVCLIGSVESLNPQNTH